MNLLNNITTFKGERSRAVSPENPTGEKGSFVMDLEQVYNLITQDSEIKLIEA